MSNEIGVKGNSARKFILFSNVDFCNHTNSRYSMKFKIKRGKRFTLRRLYRSTLRKDFSRKAVGKIDRVSLWVCRKKRATRAPTPFPAAYFSVESGIRASNNLYKRHTPVTLSFPGKTKSLICRADMYVYRFHGFRATARATRGRHADLRFISV